MHAAGVAEAGKRLDPKHVALQKIDKKSQQEALSDVMTTFHLHDGRKVTSDDVHGPGVFKVKETASDFFGAIQNPRACHACAKPPSCLLLTGPPGTGKRSPSRSLCPPSRMSLAIKRPIG